MPAGCGWEEQGRKIEVACSPALKGSFRDLGGGGGDDIKQDKFGKRSIGSAFSQALGLRFPGNFTDCFLKRTAVLQILTSHRILAQLRTRGLGERTVCYVQQGTPGEVEKRTDAGGGGERGEQGNGPLSTCKDISSPMFPQREDRVPRCWLWEGIQSHAAQRRQDSIRAVDP